MAPNQVSFYNTSKEGEFTVFSVTPGEHPLATGVPALMKPAGMLLKMLSRSSVPEDKSLKGSSLTLGAHQPYYRPVQIRVKQGLLEIPREFQSLLGRSTISSMELHRLVVKNYIVDSLGYGRTYSNHQNTTAAAFNAGRDMKLSMAKGIGWAVDAEAGGRAYTLAFGLNEVTANGLMTDIHRFFNG